MPDAVLDWLVHKPASVVEEHQWTELTQDKADPEKVGKNPLMLSKVMCHSGPKSYVARCNWRQFTDGFLTCNMLYGNDLVMCWVRNSEEAF